MYEAWIKRPVDLLAAALLLLLLSPFLLGTALAVRLALGRPVLFRQERAGRGGRPFTLLKFRSMREGPGEDAERLTSFGRRLRATALDELPQLVNVLRGEMSLVGPRPLPPAYTPLYSARQRLRLGVRPGLAGAAQAAGRNAVPWPERLERDARYAARVTALGDLRALLGTLGVLLRGRGVTAPGHASMPRFETVAEAEAKQRLQTSG
ncbi:MULTISPECIES: sugar transferase [Acetobacterales]|uniref:sugar transferase n=1 Tax=Roseomonas sp. WGS1072 TaxID=3366816 RepID=UPI003BF32981